MAPLQVDGKQLAIDAAKFIALQKDREAHEARVAQIGADLASDWAGASGSAVQKALDDYLAASVALRREEQDMDTAMAVAAQQYSATDDGAGHALQSQMNI